MKNITILSLILFVIAKIYTQDYLISFAGAGASTTIDSVKVENHTQNKSITVPGGYQLRLKAEFSGINSINDDSESGLLIYPNPAKEYSMVEFDAIKGGIFSFKVFDLSGKQVAQKQSYLEDGKQSFSISGLGSGVYTIWIKSEGFNHTRKIISQSFRKGTIQIRYNGKSGELERSGLNKHKITNAEITMQYTTGDMLKFTGISGVYSTVIMDIPAESKTITFTFIGCADGDNNNYPVVTIGTQTWMAENLKTTKYNDSTVIPLVTDNTAWDNLGYEDKAYCYYRDSSSYANTYGALYTWAAAINGTTGSDNNPSGLQGVCPNGWHLPSDAEWKELTDYLGGSSVAGGKMKEVGTTHWDSPNTGATNESGFSALPGGSRGYNGGFSFLGPNAAFWSATEASSSCALSRHLSYYYSGVNWAGDGKGSGFSVRCVKN